MYPLAAHDDDDDAAAAAVGWVMTVLVFFAFYTSVVGNVDNREYGSGCC